MKKVSCILIILTLCVALFSGCVQNNNSSEETQDNTSSEETQDNTSSEETQNNNLSDLSIKICGVSDSLPGIYHTLEYSDWTKGSFIDATRTKNIELVVENLEITGNYIETNKRSGEFYYTHEYWDENKGVFFDLTDDGKLSSYFNPSKEKNNQILTESECIDIARAFLSKLTDISSYIVTTTFDKSQKMYNISFAKYVDGFKCVDGAEIWVEETGGIYSFSSRMLGRMQSNTPTDFDLEAVQAQIVSKLDEEYSKVKQSYDKVSYTKFMYELTIDENGEYILICTVLVDCINSYGEYNALMGERIQFLISK